MTKVCRVCGTTNRRKFYSSRKTSGIAAGACCKKCWVAKAIKWRQDNKIKDNNQRHFKNLNKQFGLTREEYDALYLKPSCAGCRRIVSRNGRKLCLDHDHKTGKHRGLLCHDCNRTIATAHENEHTLLRLAQYVKDHK